MNHPIRLYLLFVMGFLALFVYSQEDNYRFEREVEGVSEQWHSINLSPEILSKVSNDLSDIRIIGIDATRDTVEAPYLWRIFSPKESVQKRNLRVINTSFTPDGYYITLKAPDQQMIRKIDLEFRKRNFDWRVKLEGSHNQKKWFGILGDQRLLSIENESVSFSHTSLILPPSEYRYYRMFIPTSDGDPKLRFAKISEDTLEKGEYDTHPISSWDVSENREEKITKLVVDLGREYRSSRVQVQIADSFDFYRNLWIKALRDSTKTERGWVRHYETVYRGVINSLTPAQFSFPSQKYQKFELFIENRDNTPLDISGVTVEGLRHQLIARCAPETKYVLRYGNTSVRKPQYDIVRFSSSIPQDLVPLQLGNEKALRKDVVVVEQQDPLFENPLWLWGILLAAIGALGFASYKMIKNQAEQSSSNSE